MLVRDKTERGGVVETNLPRTEDSSVSSRSRRAVSNRLLTGFSAGFTAAAAVQRGLERRGS
ncbi:hypothetical protein NJ7G_2950 [Natrinema sp. J7-2]|nr:hypothetical protein NJ7G_2950 [Natrinema sp. J7-2]